MGPTVGQSKPFPSYDLPDAENAILVFSLLFGPFRYRVAVKEFLRDSAERRD